MNKEERIQVQLNQEEIQEIIYCYEKDIEYIKQLEQENNKLKEKISLLNTTNEKNYNKYCDLLKEKQELRSWLEEQYQEYKETEDERGIVLTSYAIDKLNELEGGKND